MLNFNLRKVPLLLIFLFSAITAKQKLMAQDIKGTEFWFSISKQVPLTGGPSFGNFVYVVSDFCIDSGAYLEIPGLDYRVDFTVDRGQYTEIPLPTTINGTNTFPEIIRRIEEKGIHIVTPKPVTVYLATVDAASSDGETILPVNYL